MAKNTNKTKKPKKKTMSLGTEEAHKQFFAESKDIILLAKLDTTIIDVNDSVKRYGFKKSDLIGKKYLQFVLPDYKKILKDNLKKLRQGRKTEGGVEVNAPKGRVFVDFTTIPYKENGKIVGLLSMLRDITTAKEASEEIKKTEEKFRKLFDSAGDAIVVINVKGKIIDVNSTALEYYSLEKSDIVGKKFLKFVPKKEWAFLAKEQRRLMKGAALIEGEIEIILPKGNITCDYTTTPIKEKNKITGFLVVLKNISERVQYAQELKRSEERIRSLFNSFGSGIIVTDNKGTITEVNERVTEYSGFRKKDLLGKNFLKLLPKKQWPIVLKQQLKLKTGTPYVDGQVELDTPLKGVMNLEYVSTAVKKDGKTVGMMVTLRDISGRVKAEANLKRSEEKYRELFNSAGDGIVLTDKKGIITDVNLAVGKYGFKRSDLIGKNFMKFTPKKYWPYLTKELIRLQSGKSVTGETEINTPSGTINSEYTITPLRVDKKITGFIGILRNITDKKRFNEVLKKSEERYRDLFDSAGDAIIIADRKGTITEVNKAIVDYGFKKEDMVGKNFLTFVSKKHWAFLTKDVLNLWRGKKTHGELEAVTPIGIRNAEFNSTPIRGNNKVVGFLTILRDITDRKHAMQELKESEARYRHLFDNARDPTVIMDLKGKILDANNSVKEYGFTRDELVGKNALKLIPKKYWAKILKDFSLNAMGKETEGEFEIMTPKKGNVVAIYRARPIYKDGKIIANQTTMSDITSRKKYEVALKESEARYRFLVDNSHELILIISYFGDILFANKRTLEIIGLKREDIHGKNMTQFIPKEYHKKAFDALMGEFYGKHHGFFELPIRAKNGDLRYLEFAPSSTPIYNHGKLVGVLINASDITDRKKAEKERLELYKAREFDKLKDEFFSMTAHELKTPLTPIRLESDIWLSGVYCELNKDQKESIQRISRNCNRLITLIDDILTITKIEEKKLKFDIRPMDLRHIIIDMGSDMKVQADEKGLYMKTDLPKKSLMVKGDKSRLSQVLANLINNAIKSTKAGGITVSAKEDGNSVVVSVADTGPGIPEKHLKEIFQKFYRVRHKVGERYEGAGLGLAIVKYIVEKHKGNVWVESELGKGSTFYFKIPKYNKPKK